MVYIVAEYAAVRHTERREQESGDGELDNCATAAKPAGCQMIVVLGSSSSEQS